MLGAGGGTRDDLEADCLDFKCSYGNGYCRARAVDRLIN
jgi:hypothetical protein